jgi:hypothetical protein
LRSSKTISDQPGLEPKTADLSTPQAQEPPYPLATVFPISAPPCHPEWSWACGHL